MRIDSSISSDYSKSRIAALNSAPLKEGSLPNNKKNMPILKPLYRNMPEFTREDALLSQYGKDHPVSLYDQEAARDYPRTASQVSQEYIDYLNNRTITQWDKGRFYFAVGFMPTSDNLEANLDCLAAAYVTALEHLETNFSGEQLESYKSDLEAMVLEKKNAVANYFAENVGGFLDKNGGSGEARKVYDSIAACYEQKVEQYSEFLRNNRDFANLKGTEDAWLRNDVAYMSQQLQKAAGAMRQEVADSDDHYSMAEIVLANRMVREIKTTDLFDMGGNEESIGLQAGVLLLKTRLYAETGGELGNLAGKMSESVNHWITKVIDKENERIQKLYDAPYYDKDANPIYDVDAIRAMSEKMLLLYSETERDYAEAILKGIELARTTSNQKENQNNAVLRYRDNSFWSQFYDNSRRLSSKYYMHVPGSDTRTDFCKLVDSWNQFASQISKSQDFQLNANSISVLV